MPLEDARIRLAAFDWLREQVVAQGEVLPRKLLEEGFLHSGRRVPLVAPKGIFKPAVLAEVPLSITTTTESPYSDELEAGGRLRYSYRGTDPHHPDNEGLRRAMLRRLPLAYFHSVIPGHYLAAWPVFVVGDDPARLQFLVSVDESEAATRALLADAAKGQSEPDDLGRRAYITTTVLKRIHQQGFRERVLRAYRDQCALCRLRHRALLDAAHIIPDREEEGHALVTNGLALCKLHHAAYDAFFLAITPDYRVVVRADLLDEKDGPMLRHALQGMHETTITLPRDVAMRPNRSLLEKRFSRFASRVP